MGSEWREGVLSSIAELTMGYSPSGESCNSFGEGIPLLNGPTEFGGFNPDPVQYTTDPKKFAEINDLLFCVRGSTTGRMNWADRQYAIGRGLAAIHHIEGREYKAFLKGVIDHNLPRLLIQATGSTFPNVSRNQLLGLEISIPTLSEQRKIAHIFGSFDDKIELNRRMNETLEAMAQALFQSWFVDFDPVIDMALAAGKAIPEELQERAERRRALGDRRRPLPADVESLFPDEFEYTDEMGWVPKGWEVGTYIDVTDSIFSGGTPDTRKDEYWNGPFSWFSSGETRETFITESEKNITSLGIKNSSTKLAKQGDTLIASAGQGHTRGQTSFCSIETYFNQSVVCLRPLNSDNSYWLFFSLYRRYDEFRAVSDSHSIRGSLTTRLISSLEILMPSSRSIKVFSSTVSGFIDKIISNKREIHHLSGIRDTLLPKLISGELRIPDADKLVEKVL